MPATADEPMWRIYPLACLAEALLARHDAERAIATARDALDTAARVGGHHFGDVIARYTLAAALEALGRTDEARAAASELRGVLEKRAAAVTDATRRKSMLENVRDNRLALELATRLGV
jgi:hypothetical protein